MTRIKSWKVLKGSTEETVTVSVTLVTEVSRAQVGEIMVDVHRAMTERRISEALLRKLAGLPSTENSGEVVK